MPVPDEVKKGRWRGTEQKKKGPRGQSKAKGPPKGHIRPEKSQKEAGKRQSTRRLATPRNLEIARNLNEREGNERGEKEPLQSKKQPGTVGCMAAKTSTAQPGREPFQRREH